MMMVMMMTSARRDISDMAEIDIGHSFGTDLGHEIHPNRHRHHSHDIYIAGFFPTSPGHDETSIGQGVMPAVKLALHDVNRSPDVLPNHHLRMHWNNTACNPGVGLRSFFELVHNGPKKLILFGGACSMVTDQIVKAARHWNLVQVTYADTHPMFTSRSFPHFFRVVPSENEFNDPRLALLKQFNWTRVGTLYQNQARYSLAHNDLIRQLRAGEFQVVLSQSFNDELTTQLEALKDKEKDIRIILGNFNETWARIVFCEAYKIGLYGDKIQWLIVGGFTNHWWKRPNMVNCTHEQMAEAVQGTMMMEIQPISSCKKELIKSNECPLAVSTKTAKTYEEEYLESASKVGRRHDVSIYSRFHGYAYDGIWTMARAIDQVERDSKLINETLVDFKYKDLNWEKRFIRALNHTAFEGVTGPVRFKENSRLGNILINQIIYGDEARIGEYSGVTRTLHMDWCKKMNSEGQEEDVFCVVWPNNKTKPPLDHTVIKIEQTRVNPTVYATLCVAASMGIILGFAFLGINIKYRHQKQIKMSSPNLNNLIIIGCLLCYSSVIILGLDSSLTSEPAFRYICTVKAWVLMAGFTLSFGSMFSKTWRVHSIFTNVQLNKKVMKDSQLFLVVGVLLTIDITIMTTWHLADPFYREVQNLKSYVDYENDSEFIVIPRNENCKSDKMTIFVGVIYAYKGLLLLFGAFLAWETRNVQIPALNDSKYVGMSVYNVMIMCVLGVAISAVLNEQRNSAFILIAVFIIFCTTLTLCLVFVPKLIELRQDPQGVRRKAKGISVGKEKFKFKNELTSLDDKLRIADKVHQKYLELGQEKISILKQLLLEVGSEAEFILAKAPANVKAQVSSANEKPLEPELCSPMSERTTTLMDSGVESSNSENINKRDDGPLLNFHSTSQHLNGSSVCTNGSSAVQVNGTTNGKMFSPPATDQAHLLRLTDPITEQRLYEAQRDLSPLNRDSLAKAASNAAKLEPVNNSNSIPNNVQKTDAFEMERHRSCSYPSGAKNLYESPLNSPQHYIHNDREEEEEDHCNFPYECSGSSSSLSSGSGSVSELYCSARPDKTYYRVQESFESGGRSTREDQATQTDDDEADICDNVTAVGPRQRPTSFKCGGDFYEQVRSQEELNRRTTLLGSIYDLQDEPVYGWENKSYLCKSESLGPDCASKTSSGDQVIRPSVNTISRPRSQSQAKTQRSCQSSNYLNGISSQQQMVPIFHSLLETSKNSKSLANHFEESLGGSSVSGGGNNMTNMVSCPNIAVRCDIVEYL